MAGKMQNVDFDSVAEFLDFLPPDELKITEVLRSIVLECIPDCDEKLSFNVPFYSMRKNICFIWPTSILWGKKKKYEGVRLGFHQANLIDDPLGFIDMGGRKQVGYHDFLSLADIDRELLESYLFAAIEIDQAWKPAKQSRFSK